MKAYQIMVTVIAVSLLNLGCRYTSTIGPVYGADRPVMLGQVQRIGGERTQLVINKKNFNVSHYSGHKLIGFNKAPFVEGDFVNNTYEFGELGKNIVAPDNIIKVDSVYFGSMCFVFVTIFLINIVSFHNSTGIRGGVYGNSVDKIDNSVQVMRALGGNP